MQSASRAALAITALLAALASAHADRASAQGQIDLQERGGSQKVNRDLHGWPMGEFTLIDHNGMTFTRERLQGRWTFVLLGDTRCAERCAAALSAWSAMCVRIAPTQAVKTTQLLFVSLDPARDSPEHLRRYLAPYGDNIIGASGPRESLKDLMDDLSFSAPADPQSGGYAGSLLLIGPDGIVRGELLPPFEVPLLTARFLKMRIGR